MYEKEDLISELLVDNSGRRKKQKALDIRVIMGNPPYSSGDKDDEDNKSVSYPFLDERITKTYVEKSSRKMGKSKLYDSYIRAIRWASDRVGESGVVGFVSGSSFLEKPATDGMRTCLAEEFTSIYVFNLRGDIRKNMLSKGKAKEGQNIFGGGSMTGISITFFVKNPNSSAVGKILYHDIGDDLKELDKLKILSNYQDISGVTATKGWQIIVPDQHNDWIKQRQGDFSEFIMLGSKTEKSAVKLFRTYSMGIKTNRDEWVYQYSKNSLKINLEGMIDFYNNEVRRLSPIASPNIDGTHIKQR